MVTTHQLSPRQTPSSSISLSHLPCIYCHMFWDTPLSCVGQLSWLCAPPASCAAPASLLAGQCEKLESPWHSVITAVQPLKPQCVISIILILNPKYSIISTTRKKINSMPDETRTISTPYSIPPTTCLGSMLSNTFQLITTTFPVLWYIHTHMIPLVCI